MKIKIAAVIPARYESTRYRGKPLAVIAGKYMIERVYRQVQKSERFPEIIVATDDMRIVRAVEEFGGTAILTSGNITSGSDRVWEVIRNSDFEAAINIQGDEPLISEKLIAEMYDLLTTAEQEVISAVYYNSSYVDFNSRNIVKVVLDNHFRSLYFSRSPIPFTPGDEFKGFYQHIGIYGYLKGTLEKFVNLPCSQLESQEKLEQLRFLSNGIPIKMITSNTQSVGVDVPEDIKKIETILNDENEKN
ncbi:MAG: 3-deoxy-manno-octulosonate cytidylyltransferase [Candidatus Aminicenantes bacterium]|nr:3-deoxy-manno-octulosonate cytidylyltransferase [Candidatus Aminicenantes bacterium]